MKKLAALFVCALVVTTLASTPLLAQAREVAPAGPEVNLPATTGNIWNGPEGPPLIDNGPLITTPGGGFGGADLSALQTALLMNTLGAGHQVAFDNRVADDFEVPAGVAGWQIDECTFFAYQTGSPTTSTITAVNLQIWDGAPPGGTVVFGDGSTNRLASTAFSNIFRATDTDGMSNLRPIMANTVTVGTFLTPGTYWLDWQTDGTLGSGPWAPPVSILGQTTTGDALQSTDGGATYPALTDTGTITGQGLPFICTGSVTGLDADLEITKDGAANGGNVTFDITVNNNGPDDATNVVVTDPLPPEVAYVSDDCGGQDLPPWTWNVGTLAATGSATCTITTTLVDPSTSSVTNTATVNSDNTDPVTANNSGTATVTTATVLEIPTLGYYGMLALLLVLAGAGLYIIRRR